MIQDLQKARQLLATGRYTCVICRGDDVYTTADRGVKPLLNWLEQALDLTGSCAADKVVGRATAFLYCLLGVKAVHAHVMSLPAQEILHLHGIEADADTMVEGIINRQGTGPCPFEAAVIHISDPNTALASIRQKWSQLQ